MSAGYKNSFFWSSATNFIGLITKVFHLNKYNVSEKKETMLLIHQYVCENLTEEVCEPLLQVYITQIVHSNQFTILK